MKARSRLFLFCFLFVKVIVPPTFLRRQLVCIVTLKHLSTPPPRSIGCQCRRWQYQRRSAKHTGALRQNNANLLRMTCFFCSSSRKVQSPFEHPASKAMALIPALWQTCDHLQPIATLVNALFSRSRNRTGKICCWSSPWQDALHKLAAPRVVPASEKDAADGAGGERIHQAKSSSKVNSGMNTLRRRRGGVIEQDNSAICTSVRVLGHGPRDLQGAQIMFVPVSCVPPSLRRVVAEEDETVCFFMVWSGSLSDLWHEEVTCDV